MFSLFQRNKSWQKSKQSC